MTNPILAQMTGNNGVAQAVQLYKAYQAAKNPAAALQQMMSKNPMLAQIKQMGDPQQAFYSMCQQKGVDPQSILSQFR